MIVGKDDEVWQLGDVGQETIQNIQFVLDPSLGSRVMLLIALFGHSFPLEVSICDLSGAHAGELHLGRCSLAGHNSR